MPVPDATITDAGVVGSRQNYILSGMVDHFVPDEEIADIKEGREKCLFVWGLITYEDMFGGAHYTKFCQQITWWPNGTVLGYYIGGRNDAD